MKLAALRRSVFAVMTAGTALYIVNSAPVFAAPFDVRAFLCDYRPGADHEDYPHGVPTNWDWPNSAVAPSNPEPPDQDTRYMNWWGEIYVNYSNVRPANTRVALKNGQLWVLPQDSDTWVNLQRTDDIRGGAWLENYSNSDQAIDMKVEPDGSRSMVTTEGHNAHFWPNLGFTGIPSAGIRAVLSLAHTRLILDDSTKTDDRDQSAYIIALGADWRKLDGSCPNNICTGAGHGRYIKPANQWRAVLMNTMNYEQLQAFPMPPDSIFVLPDGSYPPLRADRAPDTIPGRIEGENFTVGSDILTYNDSTASAQKYQGFFSVGEWARYNVYVAESGSYEVDFRVASQNGGSQFQLKKGDTVLTTIDVGNTGGWESWETMTQSIELEAGPQTWTMVSSGTENFPNLDYIEAGLSFETRRRAADAVFQSNPVMKGRAGIYGLDGRLISRITVGGKTASYQAMRQTLQTGGVRIMAATPSTPEILVICPK
jgi:hypothetical protein